MRRSGRDGGAVNGGEQTMGPRVDNKVGGERIRKLRFGPFSLYRGPSTSVGTDGRA